MDILQILEQFGVPVAMTIAFGFFIWRQNKFIQETLMNELDQDFKRLEGTFIFTQGSTQTKIENVEKEQINTVKTVKKNEGDITNLKVSVAKIETQLDNRFDRIEELLFELSD